MNIEDIFQNNPSLVVVIVDFSAKSITFFFNDATIFEISGIKNIGFNIFVVKVTREPPYILDTSTSCINLIFT